MFRLAAGQINALIVRPALILIGKRALTAIVTVPQAWCLAIVKMLDTTAKAEVRARLTLP